MSSQEIPGAISCLSVWTKRHSLYLSFALFKKETTNSFSDSNLDEQFGTFLFAFLRLCLSFHSEVYEVTLSHCPNLNDFRQKIMKQGSWIFIITREQGLQVQVMLSHESLSGIFSCFPSRDSMRPTLQRKHKWCYKLTLCLITHRR
jgi:hypothetical protein